LIGERRQIEEIQLGGRVLSLAGKLHIEPCEVKAGRDACTLALLDKPEEIVPLMLHLPTGCFDALLI